MAETDTKEKLLQKEDENEQSQPPQKKVKIEKSSTELAHVSAGNSNISDVKVAEGTVIESKKASLNEDEKEVITEIKGEAEDGMSSAATDSAAKQTNPDPLCADEKPNEVTHSSSDKLTDTNTILMEGLDPTNVPTDVLEKSSTAAESSETIAKADEKETVAQEPLLNGTKVNTAEKSLMAEKNDDVTESAKDFRGGKEAWQSMLYELLLFKSKNGDFNIRHDSAENKALYYWVQNQRKHYKLFKEGKPSFLTDDRIAVLDAIQFQWNIRGDGYWNKNYEAVCEYKKEHGHTMVPRLWKRNPKLGEWVTDQRRQYKAKMEGKPSLLSPHRKAKLDEIDFVWRIRNRTDWSERYEQLLQFKKQHGHTVVPQHYAQNRALGKWVAKQREQYRFQKEGKHSFLTQERIEMLETIGFTWSIKGRAHKEFSGQTDAAGDEPDQEIAAQLEMSNNSAPLKKDDERLPELQQILGNV